MINTFPVLQDLPAEVRAEIERIRRVPVGQRTSGETAYLAARSQYVTFDGSNNITRTSGTTIPAPGTSGYANGCEFLKVDFFGNIEALYENNGDSNRCEFVLSGSGSSSGAFTTVSTDGRGDYDTGDYTNPEDATNAAIALVNSLGGGIVHVNRGTYACLANVVMASGVILEGEGDATVFSFTVTGTHIRCRDIINYKIRDLKVDTSGKSSGSTAEHSIQMYGVQHFEVYGCSVSAYAFGIFVGTLSTTQASFDGKIHGNKIIGACRNDLIGGGPNGDTDPAVYDITVDNNWIMQDKTLPSVGTYYTAMDITGGSKIKFTNNTVYGSIFLGSERDPDYASDITNNNVFPVNGDTTNGPRIIIVDNANSGDTSGKNNIVGNFLYGGAIEVLGLSGQPIIGTNITSNIVYNKSGFSTLQRGVRLSFADKTNIVANQFFSNDATSNYGVSISDSNYTFIDGNTFDSYTTGIAEFGTCTNTRIGINNYPGVTTPIDASSVIANSTTIMQGKEFVVKAASNRSVIASETDYTFTNEGATASVNFTLPTCRTGLVYKFVVQDTDGVRITCQSGQTIRIAGVGVTGSGGHIDSTTQGGIAIVSAINATEWVAMTFGTWTAT